MTSRQLLIRLRAAIAYFIGLLLRALQPVTRPVAAFVYETWARSQIRGVVAPGVQFFGFVHVLGTGNIHIGAGSRLGRDAVLETQGAGRIEIGRNCTINANTTIVAHELVAVDDFVLIGEYTSVRDSDHGTSPDLPIRLQPHEAAAIRIERDVWLGRGVCVLKGTRIEEGSIVGANSVVTKDLSRGSIAVGAPARVIAHRGTKFN